LVYEHENGVYKLVNDGSLVLEMSQVSMAFDPKSFVVHKHGPYDAVRKWWTSARDRAPDLFRDVQIVTFPKGFSVNEINSVLSTSGYMRVLLSKIGTV
jgi:hypothetical protein